MIYITTTGTFTTSENCELKHTSSHQHCFPDMDYASDEGMLALYDLCIHSLHDDIEMQSEFHFSRITTSFIFNKKTFQFSITDLESDKEIDRGTLEVKSNFLNPKVSNPKFWELEFEFYSNIHGIKRHSLNFLRDKSEDFNWKNYKKSIRSRNCFYYLKDESTN